MMLYDMGVLFSPAQRVKNLTHNTVEMTVINFVLREWYFTGQYQVAIRQLTARCGHTASMKTSLTVVLTLIIYQTSTLLFSPSPSSFVSWIKASLYIFVHQVL